MSDEHQCTGGGDGHRHDVTCREISEFLLAYLELELESEAREEFERHLNRCPPCVHYLDGYRETIELVRRCVRGDEAPACDPSPRAHQPPPAGLIQAILAAKKSLA
jgi:anti-sigma factor (TIGR02949 family)